MLTFGSEEGYISGVSSVVIFANETNCLSKKFNFFMTGFYMIGTSVMKEVKLQIDGIHLEQDSVIFSLQDIVFTKASSVIDAVVFY